MHVVGDMAHKLINGRTRSKENIEIGKDGGEGPRENQTQFELPYSTIVPSLQGTFIGIPDQSVCYLNSFRANNQGFGGFER